MAATSRLPVSRMALRCRGATNPATPVTAKFISGINRSFRRDNQTARLRRREAAQTGHQKMARIELGAQGVEIGTGKEERLALDLPHVEAGSAQRLAHGLDGEKMHVVGRAADPRLDDVVPRPSEQAPFVGHADDQETTAAQDSM